MNVDAAAAAVARGSGEGNVDRTVEGAEESPEHGCGSVAEDGSLAAGENRRHEAAVQAQAAMPDRVDAAMDAVQLSAVDSVSNRPRAQARGFELSARNYSVLPSSEGGNLGVGGVAFLTHLGT